MKERGAFDRVLDFIVKDGPENRMALICRSCGAHNGLCLLDEYDFTGSFSGFFHTKRLIFFVERLNLIGSYSKIKISSNRSC
jgi:Predicted integral membrane zinc-ribbon metal-binding protein